MKHKFNVSKRGRKKDNGKIGNGKKDTGKRSTQKKEHNLYVTLVVTFKQNLRISYL